MKTDLDEAQAQAAGDPRRGAESHDDELVRLRKEVGHLRREVDELDRNRGELIRTLNRVIAIGDFAMKCRCAETCHDVLGWAVSLLSHLLQLDCCVAFGFDEPCEGLAIEARPSQTWSPEVLAYLRALRVPDIVRLEGPGAAPFALAEQLFPDLRRGTMAVILPIRPDARDSVAVMVGLAREGLGGIPSLSEDDGTFLVLLSNHVDRALQSVLLVNDLRSQKGELHSALERLTKNITDLERTQTQLLEARKLEAIGRLAGGAAHDFNNLLMIITSHAEFLREKWTDELSLSDIGAIQEAAGRAARITKQLLAFGRRGTGRTEILNLHAMVGDFVRNVRSLVGDHITFDIQSSPTVDCINMDRAEFEQVLLNLLVNARDAMPRGGTISIATRRANSRDFALTPAPLRGPFLVLSVSDTGSGMSEETRSRIFEPFFTTKGPQEGTGLGLATVYGIVERNGGRVDVRSALGEGSTFTVLLPSAQKKTPHELAVPTLSPSSVSRRVGTILLVEDDPHLRKSTARVLSSAGHTVHDAASGEEALLLAESTPFDIVVTDVVMENLTGPKLIAILRARREVRAIYISGYTFDILGADELGEDVLLTKPFSSETLLHTVGQVLDPDD